MKLTKTQLRQMIQEAASEYVWGVKNPGRVANKYKISVLKKLIKEELNEVYSEKQRRWACAQTGDDFKGERSLTKKEAEEMCKGPMKEDQVGPPIMDYSSEGDEEVLESIFNLAQDMGKMTTAIKNPQAQAALSDLIAEMLNTTQEYM